MDLRHLFAILRRRGWLLLIGPLIAGTAAFLVGASIALPATYQASALVLVGSALAVPDANPQVNASQRVSLVYVEVATSRPLLQRVAEQLGPTVSADALQAQVTVETEPESPLITVTATATDPTTAADIANEVVRQLISVSPTLQAEEDQVRAFVEEQVAALQDEIETLVPQVEALASLPFRTEAQEERLTALNFSLRDLRSSYAALISASSQTASNTLSVIEEAVAPVGPMPSARRQTTILAAILGLVLAIAVVFLVEHLDDSVKSASAIEGTTRAPNLGEIGRIRRAHWIMPGRVAVDIWPNSATAESFRTLRANIEFSSATPLHSLLVTSPLDGEGKSTVAANLAVVFAQAGRRVIVVDASLRNPQLHQLFGLSNRHGLSDLLRSSDPAAADLTQQTHVDGLRVLTAGVPPLDPGEADRRLGSLRSKGLGNLIGDDDNLVIIDGPSVLVASESILLSAMVDATVLVVATGHTRTASLAEAVSALARAKANVVGTVMNSLPHPRSTRANNRSALTGKALREQHLQDTHGS